MKKNGYYIHEFKRKCTTSDPQRLLLHLADKTKLKRGDKYSALADLSVQYSCKNMKLKISALTTGNDKLEILDVSYSVSNIQHHFECVTKIQETLTDNPPIHKYAVV